MPLLSKKNMASEQTTIWEQYPSDCENKEKKNKEEKHTVLFPLWLCNILYYCDGYKRISPLIALNLSVTLYSL